MFVASFPQLWLIVTTVAGVLITTVMIALAVLTVRERHNDNHSERHRHV